MHASAPAVHADLLILLSIFSQLNSKRVGSRPMGPNEAQSSPLLTQQSSSLSVLFVRLCPCLFAFLLTTTCYKTRAQSRKKFHKQPRHGSAGDRKEVQKELMADG